MIKNTIIIIVISTLLVSCKTTNKSGDKSSNAKKTLNVKNYKNISQTSELKYKNIKNCTASKKTLDKSGWKDLVNIANSCINKSNYKSLLVVANHLSVANSNMPWGNYFKSHYYSHQNLDLKALWLIDSSIEKAQNIGLFHYQKAVILNKLKYVQAAQQSAQRSIELSPNNFGAQLLLGEIELHAGNYKKSMQHAKFCEKLIQGNNSVNTLLADVYFETKDYKNAITYLGKVKNKSMTNDINFKLAYSYENLENKEKSISYYKLLEKSKKANLLNVYGLDVNEKIKEMQVEIAKLEQKKRQPTSKEKKKDGQ